MNIQQMMHLPRTPVPAFYASEFERDRSYTNWRPEGSGDWLVIYTLGGSGRVGNGKTYYDTQPNDLIVFERDEPQAYLTSSSAGSWRFAWSHCTYKPIGSVISAWERPVPSVRLLAVGGAYEQEAIVECLRELVRLTRSTLPLRVELGFNQIDRLLLLASQTRQAQAGTPLDPRVERAMHLLSQDYSEPFLLRNIAAKVGLSPSRLAHLFQEQTGQTLRVFAEERRMAHARQLLRLTALTVSEIAAECGFDSPFYFTNRFRLTAGRSPREFRRQEQK